MSTGFRTRHDLSGASLTTFAVGGPLRTVLEPYSVSGAIEAVRQAGRILGAGSNVVVPDRGLQEPILMLGREFNHFEFLTSPLVVDEIEDRLRTRAVVEPIGSTRVLAFAATPLMALSRKLCAYGYSGLEFAAGIPATVGGAMRMNAGAHGKALGEVTRSVIYVDSRGALHHRQADQLEFRYRECSLPSGAVVLAVELELERGSVEQIGANRNRCLEHRRLTQPLHLPSAGSVFRNPSQETVPSATLQSEGAPIGATAAAGWLLEQAGLKGVRRGGIEYSPLHANWLVKVSDEAKADDVRALVELGQHRVSAEFGIELRPEIVFW